MWRTKSEVFTKRRECKKLWSSRIGFGTKRGILDISCQSPEKFKLAVKYCHYKDGGWLDELYFWMKIYPLGPRLCQRSHTCYIQSSCVVPRDRVPSQTVPSQDVSTYTQDCYNGIDKLGKKWLCVLFLVWPWGLRAVTFSTKKKTFAQNKTLCVPGVRLAGYTD